VTGIDKKLAKRFEEFLQAGGAEILKTTNAWELARFKTANGICVVYQKANGKPSYSNEHAHNAYTAFHEKRKWTAGEIVERIRRKTVEELLIERDGNECFFCGLFFVNADASDRPTLEHLLSISDGGNNHLANLCLAHEKCNKDAASLSIVEKAKLREKRRAA
jgi:5-methylcytosine-specific restriction endonuclease McrA